MSRLFFPAIILLTVVHIAFCSDGFTVKGKVLSENKGAPVPGTRVEIFELNVKTFTDSAGFFILNDIPAGSCTIVFSRDGFLNKSVILNLDSASSKTDLVVILKPFEPVTDTIDVNAEIFRKDPQVNTSYNYAVFDEIRKTPGAVEDIIKYFQSSPGVSTGNDEENDIICRGGSPIENLTLIDDIEIENPNHYGPPGSTSGALSYINLKMVQEADFYSGGFPVKYGERLSSVLDIKFKDGSKEKHIRDINLSFAGFGGFFEGPITSKSSYMFSIRRSYLELLKDFIAGGNVGGGYVLPNYWDANLKLNYNISADKKLSITGIFALDKAKYISNDDELPVNLKLLTYGVKYTSRTKNSLFKLIFSHNYDWYIADYDNFSIDINQNQFTLKTDYSHRISKNIGLNLFCGDKIILSKYDVFAYFTVSPTGYLLKSVDYNSVLNTYKLFGGFNFTWSLLNKRLTANAGVRADYLEYMTYGLSISPRAGLTYRLNDKTNLNFNIGYFRQAPEFLWLLSADMNKNLSYINSSQAVLGAEHFFSGDLRINLEGYYKFYTGYPVSIYNPYYMFIYGLTGIYPDFLSESVSRGRGYFAGIDFTLQKKNSGPGFYGLVSYSYTKSKFYAMSGGPHPSGFDYGNQFTIIAGWKLNSLWAISMKVRYYDGKPYTPFDSLASVFSHRGVYDMSLYQGARMPYYLRIDLRIDKEFDFGWSYLTVYAEVQNILDRRNPWIYTWSSGRGDERVEYQWPRLPILGISYRF